MTRRTTNEVHPSQQSQLSAGSVRIRAPALHHCTIIVLIVLVAGVEGQYGGAGRRGDYDEAAVAEEEAVVTRAQ